MVDHDKRVAIHEAGHAVVANELGLSFERIEFGLEGDNEALGHLSTITGADFYELGGGDSKLGEVLECEARGVTAMGGFAAVALCTGNLDDGVEGAAVDRGLAKQALYRIWSRRRSRTLTLEDLHTAAARILDSRWNDVETLADALLRHRALDRRSIEAIIGVPRRPSASLLP